MIHSMTAFASRSFSDQGERFRLELRSVNHRFLELKLRMPKDWTALEIPIRRKIECSLQRGSVELSIDRDSSIDNGARSVEIDFELADAVWNKLTEWNKSRSRSAEIQLRDVLSYPDVVGRKGCTVIPNENILMNELDALLLDFVTMRRKEGAALQAALTQRIDDLSRFREEVVKKKESSRALLQEKRKKRIEQCFEAYATPNDAMRALMETRVAQEVALLLDRLDIDEEIDRLGAHFGQFKDALQIQGAVGKKLEFLCQELHREVNTLGSKAQDFEINTLVVQAKVWVEQLREQCANVE